ncbi:hypothetical protein GR160_07875 [Flavobacterium sp. Sd200]|uniref:hypothetical protein n=1 Tax=Flavobacterium sp. Sd200 TaxID=2692211 RepID=UPI0013683CEF|nr:hypothetical protein [Flavobacterium sp. Sd200]MXN91147.1 hypothetical protein [Flavobacterium sp. Sd200]
MPSQPFTPAGVTAKTTELYALSDSLLFAQADAVESDFKLWMTSNFSLTTPQADYLANMNPHVIKYYGIQCSMAFRGRLSILLVSPTPILGYVKWQVSESTLAVKTNASGALVSSGSLTFKIEYLP